MNKINALKIVFSPAIEDDFVICQTCGTGCYDGVWCSTCRRPPRVNK